MIRLYDYWRSSASYRVRIALNLTQEKWSSISINLVDGEQVSKTHLDRNPQGLVPALEIDGKLLTQSLAIIEYLDETRNLGLLPVHTSDRAQVRALSQAIAMEIHPVCNLRVAKFATSFNTDLTMQKWMQRFIGPGLEAFEKMLAGGDFCFGDKITLADLCLMPQLYNAERWQVNLSDMPKIQRIADNLASIDAFDQAHPDNSRSDI